MSRGPIPRSIGSSAWCEARRPGVGYPRILRIHLGSAGTFSADDGLLGPCPGLFAIPFLLQVAAGCDPLVAVLPFSGAAATRCPPAFQSAPVAVRVPSGRVLALFRDPIRIRLRQEISVSLQQASCDRTECHIAIEAIENGLIRRFESSTTCPLSAASLATQRFNSTNIPGSLTSTARI